MIKQLFLFSALAMLLVSWQAAALEWAKPFTDFYVAELGSIQPCQQSQPNIYRVCSGALKNDGNGPYIYHHGAPTDKTIVLFHGLSDSPFFFQSIAPALHEKGYTVIAALLPGHGKKSADADMEDSRLVRRWSQHVDEVIEFAHSISPTVYVGGFSTGGALATLHVLENPDRVKGLLLFSGALALDESVEGMANIWGIKWLAKIMDGDYVTDGPNPYKYPEVAKYSAFMLTDVIFSIRDKFEQGLTLDVPIFSAHSLADDTTPITGVESLIARNDNISNTFFIEASLGVCHADLVVNAEHVEKMNYDASQVDASKPCKIPKANPEHANMLKALMFFLDANESAR